jgi:hypothetical protein
MRGFRRNFKFTWGSGQGVSTPTVLCWLLATGFWNDACFWVDTSIWNDGPADAWILEDGTWNDAKNWVDSALWID